YRRRTWRSLSHSNVAARRRVSRRTASSDMTCRRTRSPIVNAPARERAKSGPLPGAETRPEPLQQPIGIESVALRVQMHVSLRQKGRIVTFPLHQRLKLVPRIESLDIDSLEDLEDACVRLIGLRCFRHRFLERNAQRQNADDQMNAPLREIVAQGTPDDFQQHPLILQATGWRPARALARLEEILPEFIVRLGEIPLLKELGHGDEIARKLGIRRQLADDGWRRADTCEPLECFPESMRPF